MITTLEFDEFVSLFKKFCKCDNRNKNFIKWINNNIQKNFEYVINDFKDIMNTNEYILFKKSLEKSKKSEIPWYLNLGKNKEKDYVNETNDLFEFENILDEIDLKEIKSDNRYFENNNELIDTVILDEIKLELMDKIVEKNQEYYNYIFEQEIKNKDLEFYDYEMNNKTKSVLNNKIYYKKDNRNSHFKTIETIQSLEINMCNVHNELQSFYDKLEKEKNVKYCFQFIDHYLKNIPQNIKINTLYKNLKEYHFYDYLIFSIYKVTGKMLIIKGKELYFSQLFNLLRKRYKIKINKLNIFSFDKIPMEIISDMELKIQKKYIEI